MPHTIKKVYQEGPYSWKIECICGWKEGALNEGQARGRFKDHEKRPVKN